MTSERPRPAFYALAPGGWRDYVTLLHLPFTAWHLGYVAIGAALAPGLTVGRLWPLLVAFFLAVGVAAHALDELRGRPMGTGIPGPVLAGLATISLATATAIGIVASIRWTPWLGAFVAGGAFLTVAYNAELFGGRFHSDAWFALSWGGFPVLAAYFAVAERITIEAGAACVFAVAASVAQRGLSTEVRNLRRRALSVEGEVVWRDGSRRQLDAAALTAANEAALGALALAICALALALVLLRLA
jgi:hypothetical protein